MSWIQDWSLVPTAALFIASALAILFAGVRMTRVSDQLADVTGMGEALFGAALLGASTSLPGIVASVTAAAAGHPGLAVSNAVGGIAAQTTFLVLADMAHRGVNLEHAAASVENLINAAILCCLLGLVMLADTGPQWTWLGVHPMSLVLFAGYALGIRLAAAAKWRPTWDAAPTPETVPDEADPENLDPASAPSLWGRFAALAVTVAVAGYLIGSAGIALVRSTGLSESVVGGLFTALATSLPELVTCVAAVRQRALAMAVGVIIGGNTFDVLFIALADVAYRDGSIYHAIDNESRFIIALTIVLTGVLLLGLLRRERRGIGNVGFEGVLVLAFYLLGFSLLTLGLVPAS
jgi:cation:H+ antiporter